MRTTVLRLSAIVGAGLLAGGALPTVANARTVLTVPASVPADCSADVSGRLQAWLQSVPDRSTVQLAKRGCYRVETEMVVRDKTGVVLDGRGSVLRRTTYTPPERRYPHANAVLRLVDFVDSEVEHLRIKGTNIKPDMAYLPADVGSYRTEVEFDHGLALHGAVRTTVHDVTVRSVWGDGIYLAGGDQWSHMWSSHVVLRSVRVYQNGRQGIAINRSRHVLVDHAYVHYSRRAAIDLEPDTEKETLTDIEIRNSDLGSNLLAVASAGAGRVNGVWIHDNVIHKTGVPWVYVRSMKGLDRHDWRIEDNDVTQRLGSPMPALAFWNTHGITISGNRMSIATTQSQLAVSLRDGSDGAVISCNVFWGAKAQFVDNQTTAPFATSDNRLFPSDRPCAGRPVRPGAAQIPLPVLRPGDVAPVVRFVATKLGVDEPGDTYGDATRRAVNALQRRHAIPTTGTVDDRVWKLLLSPRA